MPSAASHSLLVAIIVSSALFMQLLDGTVIATALPQMAVSFGTSPIDLSIGITAYILTVAVFIPVSGWVADRLGTRTVFGGAIAVFTLGSILCGLSTGLWPFTLARIVQGVGGAMMVPVGQLVVLRNAEKGELVRAMNFVTVPGLVAPVIGPPVGGFITTYASWHWIFFLNVPIGLLGIALVSLFIGNHRGATRKPLDLRGFALTSVALVALIYGLERIGQGEGDWPPTAGLLVLGAVVAALALRHARRHPHPLPDLAPLAYRTYAITIGSGALFRLMIGATPFLLPLLLQVGFGMTAFASGVLILAHSGGDLAMKAMTRRTYRRFGFRRVLVWNGVAVAAAMAAYALLSPGSALPVILAVLLVSGALRSLQFTGLNTLGYAEIPPAGMSAATTLSSMVQQISIGTGVALGAILLQVAMVLRGAPDAALSVADFRFAFIAVALLGLVSGLFFLTLKPGDGGEVSGHRARGRLATRGAEAAD